LNSQKKNLLYAQSLLLQTLVRLTTMGTREPFHRSSSSWMKLNPNLLESSSFSGITQIEKPFYLLLETQRFTKKLSYRRFESQWFIEKPCFLLLETIETNPFSRTTNPSYWTTIIIFSNHKPPVSPNPRNFQDLYFRHDPARERFWHRALSLSRPQHSIFVKTLLRASHGFHLYFSLRHEF
jgi:hypothetical protein